MPPRRGVTFPAMSQEAIQSPDKNGVCYRYVDLRFDGERTISGVALRYGDTATLPWGAKERFQAGAFGPIGNSDVILNVQHSRGRPIARTGGRRHPAPRIRRRAID